MDTVDGGFTYYNPTRLVYGTGTLAKVTEIVDGLTSKPEVVLVTGSGAAKRHGYDVDVVHRLENMRVTTYSGVKPEPTHADVLDLRAFLADCNVNLVIALGGNAAKLGSIKDHLPGAGLRKHCPRQDR